MHRNIESVQFELVCRLEPDIGSDGAVVSFMPQNRYKNASNLPQNKYGAGPFCKFRISNKLNTSGVYALVVGSDIKYVGECINLASRYNSGYGNISPRNCFKGGQDTNCRINALIYAEVQLGHQVDLWFHATREHKELETRMLTARSYVWNRGRYA